MMNEFTERFKSKSNADLIKLLENPTNFQELAVAAASQEISNRNLSESEITVIKEELELARLSAEEEKEKKRAKLEGVSKHFYEILAMFNPFQFAVPTTERKVRAIAVVFMLISLFGLYGQWYVLHFLFDGNFGLDMETFGYVISLIALPGTTVLFALKRKAGWVLLVVYCAFSAGNTLNILFLTWDIEPLWITIFDHFLPPSIILFIVTVFFSGSIWLLYRADIKMYFELSKSTIVVTSLVAGLFGLWRLAASFARIFLMTGELLVLGWH